MVTYGEKVDENFVGEGVTYVIGGRASGIGNPWTNEDWYKTAMDYDGNGVLEYLTNTTGTKVVGYFKITVHGSERMEFTYLRSHQVPSVNNQPVLSFDILP